MTSVEPPPTPADVPETPGESNTPFVARGYVVGFVGSVASIVSLLVSLRGGTPPTGWALVALLVLPFAVISVIIVVLARQFQSQLTRAIGMHGRILSAVSRQHADQLSKQTEQVGQLVDRLESQLSYQKLVADINRRAHAIIAMVAQHSAGMPDRELVKVVKGLCGDFAAAFKDAGIECRVCVKQVCETDDERAYAKTICRDRGAARDSVTHYIDQNTDFSELLNDGLDYWFCTDVSTYPNYSNTSPSYTYHSVIVWPVFARDVNGLRKEASDAPEAIVAFLCLDSEKVAAFDSDTHVHLGWVVADAIGRVFEVHFETFRGEGA